MREALRSGIWRYTFLLYLSASVILSLLFPAIDRWGWLAAIGFRVLLALTILLSLFVLRGIFIEAINVAVLSAARSTLIDQNEARQWRKLAQAQQRFQIPPGDLDQLRTWLADPRSGELTLGPLHFAKIGAEAGVILITPPSSPSK